LILALMVDTRGDLEALYCAQFPIEQRKHNVPFLLYLHLNHAANAALVPELHQRCRRLGAGAERLLKLCCAALFNPELYRQRQRVARGAFAQVFRCTLPAMGEASPATVALKLVDLPTSIHDPCAAYDLYGELTILERLRSEPGMCQMLDFGVDDECFYVVLQDYRCSLRAWRDAHQGSARASLPLLLNIFQQVVDVCERMTELGLVHYDMKGDNVLVQPLPGVSDAELFNPCSATPPFTLVVADFGESKLFGAGVAAFSARNRGTEYIKSPEMLTVSNAAQKSRATYDRRKHQV
jgi:serine/threonine protein kinase